MRRLTIVASVLAAALAAAYVIAALVLPEDGSLPDVAGMATFRDCAQCPQLIVIPAGSYAMGWGPRRRDEWLERLGIRRIPRRTVSIPAPLAVGRFEVTFDEWDACVAAGGCRGYQPADEGWGRGARPVIHVSWNDAHDYVRWLSDLTGHRYRLLTEAEWEYAARAGTTTPYPWGREASHDYANYGEDQCCTGRASGRDQWMNTAPVGQFPANRFGLHDMIGNVYEWVEDCYVESLEGAPTDGAAVTGGDCANRVLRGAAWYSDPRRIMSNYRAFQTPDKRDPVIGFRVARAM